MDKSHNEYEFSFKKHVITALAMLFAASRKIALNGKKINKSEVQVYSLA